MSTILWLQNSQGLRLCIKMLLYVKPQMWDLGLCGKDSSSVFFDLLNFTSRVCGFQVMQLQLAVTDDWPFCTNTAHIS